VPVILAIPEAEIKRIEVQSHHRLIVQETLSRKYPTQKWVGGVAQGVGPTPAWPKNKKLRFQITK
jgi:hypothetical protein